MVRSALVLSEIEMSPSSNMPIAHFNRVEALDAYDQTLLQAGRVGLWTTADSITYFDDLKVEPLEP